MSEVNPFPTKPMKQDVHETPLVQDMHDACGLCDSPTQRDVWTLWFSSPARCVDFVILWPSARGLCDSSSSWNFGICDCLCDFVICDLLFKEPEDQTFWCLLHSIKIHLKKPRRKKLQWLQFSILSRASRIQSEVAVLPFASLKLCSCVRTKYQHTAVCQV